MAGREVTDPALLEQLNAPSAGVEVTDPALLEQLNAPEAGTGEDMLKSASTGLREGVEGIGGMLGDAADLQGAVAAWLTGKLGGGEGAQQTARTWGSHLSIGGMMPDTAQIRENVTDPVVKATGTEDVLAHTPQTTAGEYSRTLGQFAPNLLSPGSAARKVATTVIPALTSETAGQVTKGSDWEPYARWLGALAGGAVTMGKTRVPAARQSVEDLKAAGNAAYKAADNAGVIINRDGMRSLARNVVDDLKEHSFDPANEPGAMPALKRILDNSDGNVTLKGLDSIRKVAANGYRPGNPSNNKVVSQIINRIDELVGSADPALMAGTDTKAGVEALQKARKTWAQARKLETVEKFAKKGEAIGNSQINQDVEGATRRQIRQLLTNESKARGFSKEELKQAKKAASMTPGMRALRIASGLAPQGRLGGIVHGMAGLMNLGTLNLPALAAQGIGAGVGYAARAGEQALSKKAVDDFIGLIARDGAPLPAQPLDVDALIRFLATAKLGQSSAATHSHLVDRDRETPSVR